jgi:phenylacetate-CoA ligase
MIWNKDMECMCRDEMKALQSKRLVNLTEYIYNNSPFYRNKFDSCGLKPGDIKSIGDIVRLPFTTKTDMRDTYPFNLFSSPLNQIGEIHVSSGTTGNPTVTGYTREDLALWSTVVARCLGCAGAKPGDMIQIAYGYGLFTGGLGLHYGALEMGLTILPMSAGQTKRQLKLMHDFKPRILACTPSYALSMADQSIKEGNDPRKSSLEIGIFGAEPCSEAMRDEIEDKWNILAADIYGLSEIIGPGVAQECTHKNGLHIFEDVFYPEVINPDTGESVAEGEDGELVITTLTKTGSPLVRYRTRDIVSKTNETCECGRTSPRISKIKGRTDDMLIIRGINVFPSQIEHVLMGIEETEPHYQLVVSRRDNSLDEIEIQVEVTPEVFSDEIKELEKLTQKIKAEMAGVLSLSAKVRLVEPGTIERSMGKAKRVVDLR